MRVTPHLIISSIALLTVLLLTGSYFFEKSLPYCSFYEEPTIVLDQHVRRVMPADAVLQPLVPGLNSITDINDPFLPPVKSQGRLNGRFPPPPLFDLPDPPPLPLIEK